MRYNGRMSPRAFIHTLQELVHTSKLYRRTSIASGVLLLACVLLPVWRILPISSDRPFIPLHYNVYMGVDEIGPWYDVFVLPGLGASLFFLNTVFQALLFKRERVLSIFFALATLATEAVLLAAMVMIVLLNL